MSTAEQKRIERLKLKLRKAQGDPEIFWRLGKRKYQPDRPATNAERQAAWRARRPLKLVRSLEES